LSAWLTTRLGDAVRSGAYWTVSWSGPDVDDALTLMCLLNRRAAQTGLLFHCARADTFSMPEGTRVQVFAPTPVASLPPELRHVKEAPAVMARALRGRG
jgi:hypothetical protein